MNNALIGERIKKLRASKNLTQQAFAESLDITQGFLSKIEKGEFPPAKVLLLAISYSYGININWLLTGSGDIFTAPPAPADAEARDPLIQRIAELLKDMDDRRKEDILRYIEEKKLLMELEQLHKK